MLKNLHFKNNNPLSKVKRIIAASTFCLALFSGSLHAQNGYTKICSASDLHLFDTSLLINDGAAFQTYLAQDRKLIAESMAITEALVDKIYHEAPEVFLVTGDLTKDGEKVSHEKMAFYLDSIEKNGVTKVYVIPGNHDVNNVHAYSYDGADVHKVDSVSPADFKTIYANFGYGEAIATDSISLTYLAKPKSNLWILGMDACLYDSNMVEGSPVTKGRFKPNTYKWVMDRLAEAKAADVEVIGMLHHGLTEHYTGQSTTYSEYVIEGWDSISANFADAGLKLVFTGHYHANDIAKAFGTGSNFIFDIETGSTVTWPCPYRVMYLDTTNQTFEVTTKLITDIDYNTNGKSFQQYAKDTLESGLSFLVNYALVNSYGLDATTAAVLTPHVVAAFLAHYAGDEKITPDESAFIAYLASSNTTATFAYMLKFLWTDLNPSDNNLILDLSNGITENHIRTDVFTNFKSAQIGAYLGSNVFETGGSGLYYIPGTNNEYYTLGDRGPNIDAASSLFTLVNNADITDTKIFPFPTYNPKIFRIALRNDSIVILDTKPILRPDGAAVTGLPNPPSMGYAGEGVLTDNTQAAHDAFLANPANFLDTLGIDCEGICMGKNNDLWISDEYGVSVWRVDGSTGKMLNRYSPFANLPAQYNNVTVDTILKYRRANRGFENIAITPSGMVYALLQSPMTNPDKKSRILRLLEINPETNATRMFAYLLPNIAGISNKAWKMGDMVANNNNEFLVLAHGTGTNIDRIMINKLNIAGATPITVEKYTVGGNSKTLEQLVTGTDTTKLLASNNGVMDIVPVQGSLFMELYNESYPAYPSSKNIWNPEFEKPEGLAILNDSTVSITFDNDFGFKSSNDADGTATANNIDWQVMVYHLTGDQKINNFIRSVESVALTLNSAVINVDSVLHLNAIIYPMDATNQELIWSSQDETVASVVNGLITGKKAGTTKIVVTTVDGSKTDTCLITVVVPVTDIELTLHTSILAIGEFVQVSATILPLNATNREITWTSEADSIATVTEGLITGISKGTTKIVVTTTDGLYTDTCLITVVVPVDSIMLSNHTMRVKVDSSITLTVTVYPTDATNQTILWSSGDETIAIVDNGVVTGIKNGTASIYATAENFSNIVDVCTVEVYTPVSVADAGQVQPISIYPVPTSGMLTIDIPKELEVSKIMLTEINGNVISITSVNSLGKVNMNLEGFAKGIYFLQFQTNKGTITNKVILE